MARLPDIVHTRTALVHSVQGMAGSFRKDTFDIVAKANYRDAIQEHRVLPILNSPTHAMHL